MASLRQLEDALSLDTSVLQALLHRNRYSHGRTLYFKRMSMALRAIQRHSLDDLTSLEQALQTYSKSRQEWSSSNKDPLDEIKAQLQLLMGGLKDGVPEVLSRIDHAADALWTEVSQGFFLPLCLVALGCLARIRVLVLRRAQQATLDLRTLWGEYSHLEELKPLMDSTFFETTLDSFVEPPLNQQNQLTRFDMERALQSLGMTRREPQQSETLSNAGDVVAMEEDEAKKPPPDTDDNDVGESISMSLHSVDAGEADTIASAHAHAQLEHQDDSDKNLQFLPTAAGKGKRAREDVPQSSSSEKKRRKKQKKKESKKKKKKSVIDDIFGD